MKSYSAGFGSWFIFSRFLYFRCQKSRTESFRMEEKEDVFSRCLLVDPIFRDLKSWLGWPRFYNYTKIWTQRTREECDESVHVCQCVHACMFVCVVCAPASVHAWCIRACMQHTDEKNIKGHIWHGSTSVVKSFLSSGSMNNFIGGARAALVNCLANISTNKVS